MLPAGRAHHTLAGLDRSGAGIVELEPAQIARQDLRQLLHQLRLDRRRKIVGVHQLSGRLPNGFGDLWMTMTQSRHIDA